MNLPAAMLVPPAPVFYPEMGARVPVYPGLGITKSGATSTALNMTGTALLSYAPAAGPAAPFVAAAGAIAMLGAQIAKMFGGCGNSCVAATELANQWSDIVEQIKATYWATPTPRYKSLQTETLKQLDGAIEWLRQGCSDPALGSAGQRCISERIVRGGTAPWCPGDHKGCDVYTTVYDPIANDPDIIPDPSWLSEATGGLMGGSSASLTPLLIGGALILALVLLA